MRACLPLNLKLRGQNSSFLWHTASKSCPSQITFVAKRPILMCNYFEMQVKTVRTEYYMQGISRKSKLYFKTCLYFLPLKSALFLTRVAVGEILWANNRAISAHLKHQQAQRVERGSIEGPRKGRALPVFRFCLFCAHPSLAIL